MINVLGSDGERAEQQSSKQNRSFGCVWGGERKDERLAMLEINFLLLSPVITFYVLFFSVVDDLEAIFSLLLYPPYRRTIHFLPPRPLSGALTLAAATVCETWDFRFDNLSSLQEERIQTINFHFPSSALISRGVKCIYAQESWMNFPFFHSKMWYHLAHVKQSRKF